MSNVAYEVAGDADGNPVDKPCAHLGSIGDVEPSTPHACEDCLREGTKWVHLRECLICGHMGCCDNSPMRHATAHWHSTEHPIMRSMEPGEEWAWCYADDLFLLPAGA
jgi:CPA1 family monovalent cation:H+ antiporter